MFASINRLISTTFKQISRGKWISFASVCIMTLAFLLISIFVILAFTSNLFLQSVERAPHIYVFFQIGTEESKILNKKVAWEERSNIEYVEYTSEAQAKEEFAQHNRFNDNQLIAEEIEEASRSLPSSLAIRLSNIDSADEIIKLVESERENNPNVFDVRYSQETINNINSLFTVIRASMAIILALLVIVVFSFTFLTIEFRTYSRAKEIEIMQLVGGSLWYIRAPFIIEGAFYGLFGALLSNLLLLGGGLGGWYFIRISESQTIMANFISSLDIPQFSPIIQIGIFITPLITGAFIGALNSLIAIIRYIK